MAIFRCNECGHVREVGNNYLGNPVKCPKCKRVAHVHDTTTFVKAIVGKLLVQKKELEELRSNQDTPLAKTHVDLSEDLIFDGVDVNNTNVLAQESNLSVIANWFDQRQIEAEFNPDAADTTGFFDEVALRLGDDFELLSGVTKQIKYIQNKGYANAKLDVSKHSQQDLAKVQAFCSELYDYSFVAKNFHNKKTKAIHLTLQTAPKIRDFFNGYWMEWYVLIKLMQFIDNNKIAAACTRSVNVKFKAGNANELDLFMLSADGVPLCIECKTGEFRHDIDKYLSLRKQLGIRQSQFVICVFGLSDEQAIGMTSMYDLTFVNERTLMGHVESVLKYSN
ncbi:DUF1887 family protein [Arenicella xantha]|uniref:Uncharacterized protein DUF1887 n=1 Tax=Arenicella xantha TaxID=644221 RepID=A0A395JIR5_9GAMM|nr:DUF1887 family protein [Arenicella xantha]RBP49915.1 uncharacterized protein DUF1887 [Arenicella xantha]